MVVVSDSTTLIILGDLQKLDYLKNIFTKIYIPKAVYDEISYQKEFVLPNYIEVLQVDESERLSELKMLLDEGESEAITLAMQKKTPLVIDEKKGRKIALNLSIDILGLLGVLYLNIVKKHATVDEIKDFITKAKENGYRISDSLIEDMFKKIKRYVLH